MSDSTSPLEAPSPDPTGAPNAPEASPLVSTAATVPADVLERAARQRAALTERYKQPEIRTAQMDGTCRSCSRRIRPGDDIAGLSGWVHLVCAVCVACGTWLDADPVDAPDGVGKVHRACTAPTS